MARKQRLTGATDTNHAATAPTTDGTPVAFPLSDAARYSGLTVWALRTAIWDRKLVARLAGKRLLVLRSDLEAYVASLPQVVSGPCNRRVA
jgi:hypothetical protein